MSDDPKNRTQPQEKSGRVAPRKWPFLVSVPRPSPADAGLGVESQTDAAKDDALNASDQVSPRMSSAIEPSMAASPVT